MAGPEQHPWLLPTFAILTVIGLALMVVLIAGQVWWSAVPAAFTVASTGTGLWNQLRIRRRTRAGGTDAT